MRGNRLTGLPRLLLAIYAMLHRCGVTRQPWFRRLFLFAYDVYKARIEAPEIERLAAFIPAGSLVVDVGANVGFMTERFARMTGPAGRVIAIEPEAQNLADLCRRLAGKDLLPRVEVVEGVAADRPGTLHLVLNPLHPADHKIGAAGVPIAAFTIDGLLEGRGLPPVSLIKIDVQGAEPMVLDGAAATIARCRPALYIEIDPSSLDAMGGSARGLLDKLDAMGYAPHRFDGAAAVPLSVDAAAALCAEPPGYRDMLFLGK
jgi:FkbM family methyltransferase